MTDRTRHNTGQTLVDCCAANRDLRKENMLLRTENAELRGKVLPWFPAEQIPEVPLHGYDAFMVAVRRKHNDKIYVFTLLYCNEHMLLCDDEDANDDGEKPFTGWFRNIGPEDEEYYQRYVFAPDEFVGWQGKPIYWPQPTNNQSTPHDQ